MKNIHVLPTDKPSRLHYYNHIDPLGLSKEYLQWKQGRNIYITSSEEIKDGDFYLYLKDNKVYQFIRRYHTKLQRLDIQKKIILTTDQDLIKDGVQAIDDEFLEWFVKNPSCEEIEVEKDEFYSKKAFIEGENAITYKYKIIIPKEEPKQDKIMERFIANAKQETLEEAAEKTLGIFYGYSFLKDIVKQLKEKRIELKISLNKMSNDLYGNRYYVNYLSKVEKGEIPNVSFEVIARITIYLEQIKKL